MEPQRAGRQDHGPPERIDPLLEESGVVAHHLAKYRFAAGFPGRRALDIGCGVGYGAAALGETFENVIGVDLSEHAIKVARDRYAGSTCAFAVMNGEALGFTPRSFDLVTCFEAIEHVADPEAFVREAAVALDHRGHFIVSTPVPGTGGSPEENPYHHREFDREDLTIVLRTRFSSVTVLTQKRRRSQKERLMGRVDVLQLRRLRVLRPLIRRAAGLASIATTEDARLEDFEISDRQVQNETEFVAVCRSPIEHVL